MRVHSQNSFNWIIPNYAGVRFRAGIKLSCPTGQEESQTKEGQNQIEMSSVEMMLHGLTIHAHLKNAKPGENNYLNSDAIQLPPATITLKSTLTKGLFILRSKKMQPTLYLKSVLMALSFGLSTSAIQAAQSGPYFGMGIGQSDDEILHETESAFKFFGGINLNENIGFELSYVDLGTFADGQLSQDGLAYELIGYLPLNSNIDLLGRAGFYNWEVADRFSTHNGTDATFGFGLNVHMNSNVSVRGEYQIFTEVDGGDVEMYSASLSFHF